MSLTSVSSATATIVSVLPPRRSQDLKITAFRLNKVISVLRLLATPADTSREVSFPITSCERADSELFFYQNDSLPRTLLSSQSRRLS